MFRILTLILALLMGAGAVAQPLRIEITDGVIEPMPFAAPRFIAQDSGAMELSGDMSQSLCRKSKLSPSSEKCVKSSCNAPSMFV